MTTTPRLAIIGTGNIGRAMALGFTAAGVLEPGEIILTRRKQELLTDLAARGFLTQSDNRDAVRRAEKIIVAVEPNHLDGVLAEIAPALDGERHTLISVVSGVSIDTITARVRGELPIVRAMPNTAIAIRQSMTCIASNGPGQAVIEHVTALFDAVGRTLVVDEEQIVPATALCACGIAFFLRAVRAASQGGIEIGFHPAEALLMAAQTSAGAAALVLNQGEHPESQIDSVTTPRGCTISGLNEMEHHGFGSAMIKGILTSAEKASRLYRSG